MSKKIGFIGLGIMGQGMSKNLLKEGFELTVWNRTASRMDGVLAEGALRGASPADVAEKSDIIITCVSNTDDVEEVILGDAGVIHGVSAGKLVIDMSTISPEATRNIAAKLAEKDVKMLDAPISGGSEGAVHGTLSIMVGGDAEDVERAMPAFNAMGSKITHVGGNGDGQSVKLVNQILVVINMLAVGEALIFAQAGGLNLDKTLSAVTAGAAGSWMLSNRGPQVIKRDWSPGFMLDLQQKDLRLVLEAAEQLGIPLETTRKVSQMYAALQEQGLGEEGNHALVKALEEKIGVVIGEKEEES